VVEHILGKDGVESSILPSGTIFSRFLKNTAFPKSIFLNAFKEKNQLRNVIRKKERNVWPMKKI
jgi:hypothetical protein